MGIFDFFKRNKSEEEKASLNKGLEKTKNSFLGKLSTTFFGRTKVDDEFLDDLEETLVSADVGIQTTLNILKRFESRVASEKYTGMDDLNRILKEEISSLLQSHNEKLNIGVGKKPYVIMVVGVNGVGKTTTIGKLANKFHSEGLKVVLGAADTFRAAAVDQLKIWSDRAGVEFISKGMNTDPAAVAYDAVKYGYENDADVVIIDTAGRLHNKVNLMNELSKIKRVMQKVREDLPNEILLVLDGTTGQNAFEQAKQFTSVTEVNALAVTKLDGTAKGGVVIGISDQFKIPVKYIGVGEGMHDLQVFDPAAYVESIFG
ncbi:MAG: signal recognition particle-docking protein FtsY [Flavobacteriales bacterium]|nr:signal recognition particle-docking protein FtsY [Flavobacteriales bacterium]